ncbi:MAG: hydrolase [Rhodospirillaceae bacterium]|nr:hydrolase [Rhodospirillaceae bacterium]
MPSCLLIIDLQKGFVNDATHHVVAPIEAAQADYDVVIATRFQNPPGSPFRRLIHWERFAPHSDETAFAFAPREDARVIDKPRYTCVDSALRNWLVARDISRVHVCGIDTDICVTKNAVDLFEAGLEPIVLSALCASHAGRDRHEAGLVTLARFIGQDQIR